MYDSFEYEMVLSMLELKVDPDQVAYQLENLDHRLEERIERYIHIDFDIYVILNDYIISVD